MELETKIETKEDFVAQDIVEPIDDKITIDKITISREEAHKTIFNTDNLMNVNVVKHPNHYGAGNGGLQCIEAMLLTFGVEATKHFCKLNAFKYIWRSDHKEKESQDLNKAKRYLEYWEVLNNLKSDKDDGSFHDCLNA